MGEALSRADFDISSILHVSTNPPPAADTIYPNIKQTIEHGTEDFVG